VVLIDPEEFGVDRETIRLALERENIESRPVWKPMHMQPVFEIVNWARGTGHRAQSTGRASEGLRAKGEGQRYKARVVGGGVSEELFADGLCLPSGTQMTESDLDRIVTAIIKARTDTLTVKYRQQRKSCEDVHTESRHPEIDPQE
jgi:dTDP-4-amino-4,6-dideoxygalactose transaminase